MEGGNRLRAFVASGRSPKKKKKKKKNVKLLFPAFSCVRWQSLPACSWSREKASFLIMYWRATKSLLLTGRSFPLILLHTHTLNMLAAVYLFGSYNWLMVLLDAFTFPAHHIHFSSHVSPSVETWRGDGPYCFLVWKEKRFR